MSIRRFYDRWPQYNRRLVETIGALSDEQLALRAASAHWPIWAIAGHVAGVRVYWLCSVLGEPGAEETPFPDPEDGWEDHPDTPRSASELVAALRSTFSVVEAVLDRWTPEMLDATFERRYLGRRQVHSRASVLQRLFTHEAYHDGEISVALGINGIEPVELWRPD